MSTQEDYISVKVSWIAKAAHGLVKLRKALVEEIAKEKGISEILWRTLRVELTKKNPGRGIISFEGGLPSGSSALVFQVVEAEELIQLDAAPASRPS